MWGGGMRQVGVIAAAARHALDHHRARLAEDHANARLFGELATRIDGARVELSGVETNIVNIDLDAPLRADDVVTRARGEGLGVNATGPRRLRAVTHLDVTRAQIEEGGRILARAIAKARA